MEAWHDHGTESQSGVRYAEWQKPYEEALIEFDKSKLPQRIAAAERAILNRREKIFGDPADATERQAMEDALVFLRVIKSGYSSS
jgi:hypothetical protein